MGTRAEHGHRHLDRIEEDSGVAEIPRPGFDPDGTLGEITRSALRVTGASGAALALSDGTMMSCRASSGYLAPPVGTRLNIDTGLTAACVQTAKVVRCDDTHADPRVDSSKCIGVRSILAVPVFDGSNVAGVLEVLSGKPGKFTDRHVAALQLLARLVETQVNYVPRGSASPADSASDSKPVANDSGAANLDVAGVLCLSCGHANPQGSQFCNRCGVIIADRLDKAADFSLPEGAKSIDYEGLREIYKLITGNAGLATWNDIYAKLLANQQAPSVQGKPLGSVTEMVEDEEKVNGPGTIQGTKEPAGRPGAVIRRSLWL